MKDFSKQSRWILSLLAALLAAILCNIFIAVTSANAQYQALSGITSELIEQYPEEELNIIKNIKQRSASNADYLAKYGYDARSFMTPSYPFVILSAVLGVIVLASMVCLTMFFQKRRINARTSALASSLAKINLGKNINLIPHTNDAFSALEDEIYKTVTELKNTKETALRERQNFAESLANIAHQIKTPLTAISIHCQLYQENAKDVAIEHIRKQQEKITQLVDALLTLSKLDSGVIALKSEPVNVYTALEVSLDALSESLNAKQMQIHLPNNPDISFSGDMDWSVEAFVNIIKNCIEHSDEHGVLDFDYTGNPLYTEITIKDNGKGFDEKELAHIFKRFYQGNHRVNQGFGIGLSLAKSIVEMQNGFLSASNNAAGGACFTIRFYH